MLNSDWEHHATSLSNCPTTTSLISTFTTLATHLHVDLSSPASVVFAYDTRPSGPELIEALEKGLGAFGESVKVENIGITTTPILHYVVKAMNDKTKAYGVPSIEGYMEKTAKAFTALIVGPS
jgi:phosphoacetylglucosamine mutase